MITLLGELADGVYKVVHVPVDSVHVEGLNEPPAFWSPHDTEPVGEVGELELSIIVAVSVTWPPACTMFGFATTVRDVLSMEVVEVLFATLVVLPLAIAWEIINPFENNEEIITTANRPIVRIFFILRLLFDASRLKLFFMKLHEKYDLWL